MALYGKSILPTQVNDRRGEANSTSSGHRLALWETLAPLRAGNIRVYVIKKAIRLHFLFLLSIGLKADPLGQWFGS